MEEFAALMLLGVRVREVRDLAEGNIWLPEDRLLLIDSTTSQSVRVDLAERLIAEAAGVMAPW